MAAAGGRWAFEPNRPECQRQVPSLESTAFLLRQVRDGDRQARERLIGRCLPLLRHWAHGRLPQSQRDLAETADLVQVALLRVLDRLDDFQDQGPGGLLAYLRQTVLNQIRDQARAQAVRPRRVELAPDLADSGSVEQHAIDAQIVGQYQRGLAMLGPVQRNAVVLRLEFGMSHAEVALELGLPSGDAARMLVARALVRLARYMS